MKIVIENLYVEISRLDDVLDELQGLELLITERTNDMSAQLEVLKTEVAETKTVIDSAITLLNGLSAKIAELKDDPVALQALADELDAETKALSDAVVANTPVEPAPPVV